MALDINLLRRKALFDNYNMPEYGDPAVQSPPPPLESRQLPVARASLLPEGIPPEFDRGALERIGEEPPVEQERPEHNIIDMMREQYKPETESTNRFNQLLEHAPELNDPSIARRLVASGQALKGGVDAAEKVMYAPYARDKDVFTTKAGPFYNAANLERQANANERTLTREMATAQLAEERNIETERKNRETAEAAKIRAEAYAFKQYHPDWKINFDGPTVIAVSPDGKQRVNLGPTGNLSEVDKLNLQSVNAVRLEQERGTQDRQTQAAPGGPADVARIRETSPGSTNPREARNNRFRAIYDQYPQYRQFMKTPATANADFELVEPDPGRWISAADKKMMEDYKAFRGMLYPEEKTGTTTTQPTIKPSSTQGVGPTKPPAAGPIKAEPRPEYSQRPVGPQQPTNESPWFVDATKKVVEGASKPPTGEIKNVYGQRVRPGYVLMKNVQTGQEGWIPQANANAAENSGKYVRVK